MRWNDVGINPDYDYLYDPQQASPAGFCPYCGAEIYSPGEPACPGCKERHGLNE